MITWETPITKWRNLLLKLGLCTDVGNAGLNLLGKWIEEASRFKSEKEELTVLDCFKIFEASGVDMDYYILWLACNIGHETEISPDVREAHLRAIRDPRMALKVYYKSPYMTDKEDEILKEKFAGLYPQAEKEISSGTIIRAKVWAKAFGLDDMSVVGEYLRTTPAAVRLEDSEINI